MKHWQATLQLWLFVLAGFWLYHASDLVRRDSALLQKANQRLTAQVNGEPAKEEAANNAIRQDLGSQLSTLQQSCAQITGANGALERQNKDQQSSINNCQNQALKLLAPEPQKITVLELDDVQSEGDHDASYLLITNKEVTPVRIPGYCDVRLKSISAEPIPAGAFIGGAQIIPPVNTGFRYGFTQEPSAFSINISSPAWTYNAPIRVKASYHSIKTAQCYFTVR